MKARFIIAVLALIASPILHAQDAPPATEKIDPPASNPFDAISSNPNAPKLVRVQVEYIELSHANLTRLMMEDQSKTTDATQLRMKLQNMIEKDEARIIDTQICVARDTEQATVESIAETIYPTEYDPPSPLPSPDDTPQSNPYPLGYSPVAFETRNVGSTLEIAPTISAEGTMVMLRFIPELVYHTGNTKWQEFKDKTGNIYTVQMPNFYTIRTNTALTTVSGQYFMAGALSPKDDDGQLNQDRKIMLFVKCDILPVVK